LAKSGVLYDGLAIVGGGSILASVTRGAIGAYIADKQFTKAAGFALAGSVLTFFGLMHGEKVGLYQTPGVAFSYLAVAAILYACDYFVVPGITPAESVDHHGHADERVAIAVS
jgi:AGZA family xanthine/uracil permease-like MFS transporter